MNCFNIFLIFFLVVSINAQQQSYTVPPNIGAYAVSQLPNIASASNEGIQALVYKIFDNITVDSNAQNIISEYARLADNPSTQINQLIQGKQKLLNSLPAKAKGVLEESFSRQRANMQDYLEDVHSQLNKNKNVASNQAFRSVNDAFAAYSSQGQVGNDITGNTICNAIRQLCAADAEIAKITQEHFKFTQTSSNYDTVCQQQVFGFLISAQGGTGTPNELLEKAKTKLQQWAQNVQNTASNAANSIAGVATDFKNTLGNAANDLRNTFNGNQQPQQQLQG